MDWALPEEEEGDKVAGRRDLAGVARAESLRGQVDTVCAPNADSECPTKGELPVTAYFARHAMPE